MGGRGWAGWNGGKGGKWGKCNSIINKCIFKKLKKRGNPDQPMTTLGTEHNGNHPGEKQMIVCRVVKVFLYLAAKLLLPFGNEIHTSFLE